ncbi:MAG: methyltransferase domain-containing protein, partial [Gammaproteobacteria bacterium]|nr:methyltransferase domain-containing protein [Gammaproteobacteria bacterium]
EIMEPYMKGLLLSQVFWKNHTLVHQYFYDFLVNHKQAGNYIEIGAGHGLFLAKACQILPQDFKVNAWDISKSSLLETQNCLDKLEIERSVNLIEQDFNKLGDDVEKADLLVFSEILEHLEDPNNVLKTLNGIVKKGGYLFLNAPINSPAPDHITNWRDADEMFGQVEDAGFEIILKQVIPSTGLTLEKALKQKGAVSVIVIARNT